MFRFLVILGFCLVLSGCAALAPLSLLNHPPADSPPAQVNEQTRVDLAKDNFTLVKTNVWGRSKGFSLLGFVTIYPPTLTKAMQRMYGSAGMQTGQAQSVAHLIIEQTSSYWILFAIPKIDVRADIIEFSPEVKSVEGERREQVSGERREAGGE
jgi:hypothetical protein